MPKNNVFFPLTLTAPVFHLTTCRLRPWREGDEDSLTRQANNRRIWDNVRDFFPFPYTFRDASSWVRSNRSIAQATNLAIEVNGRAVGNIGFTVKDDIYRYNAEIGYWLGQDYWNQGIISEALPVMVRYVFENFSINRLYACVLAGNAGSMAVLEKAGFRQEAVLRQAATKNNQTLDEYIYARLRDE